MAARRREPPVLVVLVAPAALVASVVLGSTESVQTVALPGMRATVVPVAQVAMQRRERRVPVVGVVPLGTAVLVGRAESPATEGTAVLVATEASAVRAVS